VGTSVVSAIVVDLSRLAVYGVTFFSKHLTIFQDQVGIGLVIAATVTAFLGSFIGSRLIKKITMRTIQMVVGILLLFLSLVLGAGLV